MWGHVGDEKLLDLVEGTAAADARRHVEGCAACRSRVAEAREALLSAEGGDVPEPSPMYWEAFRRQVGRRLEAEPRPRPSRRRLVAGFAGLAAAGVLAVGLLNRPLAPEAPFPTLPSWSPLPAAEEDFGLAVIRAMAPSPADLGPIAACPVEDCLLDLSDEESLALAESLRNEISGRSL